MDPLTIETWPSDVLKAEAKPVDPSDPEVRLLAEAMFQTMYENSGIGLAAPQVGRSLRMFVLDLGAGGDEQGKEQLVFLNPEFVEKKGSIVWEEGCLSLPGIMGKVKRSNFVKLRATNLDGETFEIEGTELFAVAMQHEFDHLDGILFIHRVSPLQRKFLLREYKRSQEDEEGSP